MRIIGLRFKGIALLACGICNVVMAVSSTYPIIRSSSSGGDDDDDDDYDPDNDDNYDDDALFFRMVSKRTALIRYPYCLRCVYIYISIYTHRAFVHAYATTS